MLCMFGGNNTHSKTENAVQFLPVCVEDGKKRATIHIIIMRMVITG